MYRWWYVLIVMSCCVIKGCTGTSCEDRGRNCTLCLSDGECGFCDSCGDHCHKPGTLQTLENCTGCASCIPGTLTGPQKGRECRREWYYYEKCPEVVSEQKTVYVGIALYLMNLHSVDLKAGTFHADFYLYFKVPPGQTMYTKQKCKDGLKGACFELINAAGVAEVSSHEGKFFRVKSKFNFAADLSNFPFDNQTLKIEIQDMEMTAKELRWRISTVCKDKLSSRGRLGGVKVLMHFNIHVVNKPGSPTLTLRSSRQEVYTQDVGKVYFLSRVHLEQLHMLGKTEDDRPFKFNSGIAPTLNYTGWVFDTYSWSQIVYERYNPFLDQGVSRYAFMFHMARPKRAAFFKIFLPPLFIVLVVCFAFAIPPKDATMRVWIDGNLLVSCVMFHSTMAEQTPATQELTMADKFMVGVYGFIFVSFIVSIVLLKLQRERLYHVAESFYRYAEWMVWFTAPTYFFLLYYLRMTLYHVILIVLGLALLVVLMVRIYNSLGPECFSALDKLREIASMTSDAATNTEEAQFRRRANFKEKYHPLINSDNTEETSQEMNPSSPYQPCFPGNIHSTSDECCPKQNPQPNKKA